MAGGMGHIDNHTEVLFDNFCNNCEAFSARADQITKQNIVCVEGDVRDNNSLVKCLLNTRLI